MDNQRQTHLRKGTGGTACAAMTSNDKAAESQNDW